MKKKNFQTNAYCRNTSLTSCPCDYRATWILGCEERVRDQSGGAGPGDVAIVMVMVMMEVVEHSRLIVKCHLPVANCPSGKIFVVSIIGSLSRSSQLIPTERRVQQCTTSKINASRHPTKLMCRVF